MNGLEERLAAIVGSTPVTWIPRAGGYSTAERYTVELDDGRRVFVKAADAEHMAGWLRREHEVYATLRGSFIPELIGFDDDGVRPMLVIEDLSHADWGTAWPPERVEVVRSALTELNASLPPPGTQPVRTTFPDLFGCWQVVEEDPVPFLSLGLRSRGWLEGCLSALLAAADAVPADGDALVQPDVRSDNLCTDDGRAVLVDWNWLSFGAPELDLAGWACSLRLEGGPQPWELLPAARSWRPLLPGSSLRSQDFPLPTPHRPSASSRRVSSP